MAVIDDIKHLLQNSRLFVDASTIEINKTGKKAKSKGRREKNTLKIGQGGTLDPLADGVLGEHLWHMIFIPSSTYDAVKLLVSAKEPKNYQSFSTA